MFFYRVIKHFLYASVTITVKFNLNALVRDLWPTLYKCNVWI